MNKTELIEKLADQVEDYSKIEIKRILDALINIIKNTLKKGDKVCIVGFGTFSVKIRKSRQGVNPQTGKKIKIPDIRVAKFTTGSALKRDMR